MITQTKHTPFGVLVVATWELPAVPRCYIPAAVGFSVSLHDGATTDHYSCHAPTEADALEDAKKVGRRMLAKARRAAKEVVL